MGTPTGLLPGAIKIILVVAPPNVAWAKEFFPGMGIQVATGHRYLGGFIGDMDMEKRWLSENITGWADSVETLNTVSRKHLQSAYAKLQKPPQ